MNEALFIITPQVTTEMNQALAKLFTTVEVNKVVFGMHPVKYPNPNACVHFGSFDHGRKCGISQGDPLSPHLFIFYAKGFSYLIQEAERRGRIVGVEVVEQAPRMSHFLFTNDTLIFCEAKEGKLKMMKCILSVYERLSGHVINFHKSSMDVSGRMHDIKRELANKRVDRHNSYIGLMIIAGRSRGVLFGGTPEGIWARVNGWNKKLLSQAEKEVLIKAVILSLPTHVMLCFQLLGHFLRNIESMVVDF
ncbi:UNVERIFIED_CONTAM: putative mitochondrial protein [Sesamum radiatum]|uniref:Mitochondrial protein n=1 Tax=Sesamum radiatum TaxID=300843 RepID=A0AAW2S4D5_SESRA